jgi:uracil-DNA glycosylase family 4
VSLDLDERQRAMLEEMQVRVWWPRADVAVVQAETRPAPVAAFAAAAPALPLQRSATAPSRPAAPVTGNPPMPVAAVDGMDWPELAATVAGCTACQLCIGRKAPVFGAELTTRQADWLVVGEPPDELEERAGAPFAGEAGQLLDNMLRAVQVARDGRGSSGARVTNVVKCRSAPVRNPKTEELAACAVYLRREITLVRPKVILAMGRFAALSLLAESSPELAGLPFGKLRGQVYRYRGVPVVVTHHPSRLLRAQEDKAGAWADLCLAQGIARTGLAQDAS